MAVTHLKSDLLKNCIVIRSRPEESHMISQQYISAENAHAIVAIKQLSHSGLS